MAEREDGTFVTFDNTELFWQAWLPEDVKAVNIFIHGGFSYSGDAKHIADAYLEAGIATYAYDLRGWGGHWNGTDGHVNRYTDYLKDTEDFLQFVRARHPNSPYVLTGHSMGGLTALRFLIDHQDDFVCAVVSAPWMKTKAKVPGLMKAVSKLLSIITPKFSTEPTFELDVLTHDNAIVTQHYRDVETGLRKDSATVRWFVEMGKMQQETMEQAHKIVLPLLMFQGGQDLIVDKDASQQVFDHINSETKQWEYYPRFYHEIFNEDGREEPLNTATTFVKSYLVN